MPFRITHICSDDKLCERLSWPLLERFYPRERLQALIETFAGKTTHVRKLSLVLVIYVLICWNLLLRHSLGAVFLKLSSAERWLGEEDPEAPPTRGAWTYRRKQLGVEVMRALFEQSCGLLADEDTPGAFAFGLRLMVIDGTLEDVTDTPANAAYFGRICEGKTQSPFPHSELSLAPGLLAAIQPGMLVLLDRGFLSAALVQAIRARGAHVLARLPQDVYLAHEQDLADGSYLTSLTPKTCQGLLAPLPVRIIEYRLDPQVAAQLEQITPSRMHKNSSATNPEVHQVHRLLTTLLDPELAPATAVAQCYHERWEVEEAIDETRNQQRLSQQPLRSRLPLLVLQEVYARLMAHHAVRRLMVQAAHTQPLDPDRISFTGAIQVLGQAIIQSALASPQQVERILKRLGADLTTKGALVAPRRLRFNCRVVKHICTRFRRKRPAHHNLTLKHTSFAEILLI